MAYLKEKRLQDYSLLLTCYKVVSRGHGPIRDARPIDCHPSHDSCYVGGHNCNCYKRSVHKEGIWHSLGG